MLCIKKERSSLEGKGDYTLITLTALAFLTEVFGLLDTNPCKKFFR